MLFQAEAHEPLVEERWDAERVRSAVREIVGDAESAFDDGWPSHPRGELIWCAGPLATGSNLCHSTAGYALVALFERTNDELWLERARAFAMHAIAQVKLARAEFGRGHCTLWTGDLGAPLYLADCVGGSSRFP